MGYSLIEAWAGLSPRVRYSVGVAILMISAFLGVSTWRSDSMRRADQPASRSIRRGYTATVLLGGVGFILLAFAGPSRAEKKGYSDF